MMKRLSDRWAQFRRTARESAMNFHRLNHLSAQVDQLQRETRMLLGYLSLPPTEYWSEGPRSRDGAPVANAFPCSTLCRQDSFEQPYFGYWARKVGWPPSYHRKLWEFVYICQSLWERGAIRPEARGLGFGVGREPLTAYFASENCNIVATDMASSAAVEKGWSQTIQHAAGTEALRYANICPNDVFDRRVEFRVCDMNAVTDDLTGFDFCWSACAFEHLGSIEQGLRFVERSLATLKPGGWAVHTTEFNVSSDANTIDRAATVLFRRSDFERLAKRLADLGHRPAPLDFTAGLLPLDRYIDVPPYRETPHLKLAIEGYASTSFGFIVQKGDANPTA